MALSSIRQATEGQTITFRTKNANDTVVWLGVLESIGTYRSIRSFTNPSAYNEAVRQADPSVSSDITTLTYFQLTVANQSDVTDTQIFADEWIEAGSLNIVSLGNQVTITVDDPLGNTQAILSLLANQGYACRVVSS